MSIVFTGPEQTNLFAAIALKHAIRLYVRTGMKANRAYTPAAMLQTAGRHTGKTYKRGQLQQAHDDLEVAIVSMQAALSEG